MDALSLSCCSSGRFSVRFFCVLVVVEMDGTNRSFGETDAIRLVGFFVLSGCLCPHAVTAGTS